MKKYKLVCAVMVFIFLFVSCDNVEKTDKSSAVSTELVKTAVSTLLEDSHNKDNGILQTLVAYKKDNPSLNNDIIAYPSGQKMKVIFFMPCRADVSSLVFYARFRGSNETGPYIVDFTDNESNDNKRVKYISTDYDVVVMQSALPTLCLTLPQQSGSLLKVNSSKNHSVYAYGSMTLESTDTTAQENGWEILYTSEENDPEKPEQLGIRGRGNWTWDQQKKPYQLELEKKVDLLGMGKAKKWILLANTMDATMLRNKFFYNLASEMGLEYAIDTYPVDLFVNGEYKGLYYLTEKPEIGESRVDINKETDFLFELDQYYKEEKFTFASPRGVHFTLHGNETQVRLDEISQIYGKLEDEIYHSGQSDCLNIIDIDSFVKMYWIQDLSRNNDTMAGSAFFYYKKADNMFYMGPLWDMDNTLGIWGGGRNLMRTGWHSSGTYLFDGLLMHEKFSEAVDEYYKNTFSKILGKAAEKIDSDADLIRQSAEMNYIINSREHFTSFAPETWQEDVDFMRDYLECRVNWYKEEYDSK